MRSSPPWNSSTTTCPVCSQPCRLPASSTSEVDVKDISVAAIRRAIEGGDYPAALELWNQYAAGLREALAAGRLPEPSFAEATDLVAWSRPVLLCARAHAHDRLRVLLVASAYAERPTPGSMLIRTSL